MEKLYFRLRPFAKYFLILWVVLIIVFSSIPGLPEASIRTHSFELRLDYLIHFIEYSTLAFLTLVTFDKNLTSRSTMRLMIIICLIALFATLDEVHQLFIPGRTYNIKDLLSNLAGVIAGSVITWKMIPSGPRI